MKSPKKSPGRKTSTARRGQDAVAMLKADHRKVEGLFKKAEKAKGSAKEKLVEQICNELIIHTMLEEEIFYPACRSEDVEEDMMDEAQVEHDGAKVLINDLLEASADSEMYDAKVTVLSEYIKHHVKEEEQPGKGIFSKAKKKGIDAIALGAEMAARKQELMQQAESGDLPRPEPKSIDSATKPNGSVGRSSQAKSGMGDKLRTMALKAKRATVG
jgi:hemerythrin superfamily protein